MTTDSLKKFISSTSSVPGIYIFLAKGGSASGGKEILYIGKASNIKARLSSYLKTADQRILQMLSRANGIKTIKTGSEIEALILESQYIKKYKPAFNIMLRDDKQFFYVVFTKEIFPKIFITHQPDQRQSAKRLALSNRQADFVGPFTDGTALKTTLRYLRRIFPYCTCKQLHNNYCLNYHIGKCIGVCCLKTPVASSKQQVVRDYNKNIKAIKEILSGKKNSLLKNLEKEMIVSGKKEKFQEAMELRDKIEKIKRVFENAVVIQRNANLQMHANAANTLHYDSPLYHSEAILADLKKVLGLKKIPARIEGYDVANIQGKYAVGAMVVFSDGKPDKNEYRKFKIRTKHAPDDTAMLKEILKRRFNHPEWPMPDLILVDGGRAQLNAANQVVSSKQQVARVVALTKNEKHRGEKIYVAGRSKPIPLSQLPTSVKNLMLQIDGEAHRFAIGYYRRLHRKTLK